MMFGMHDRRHELRGDVEDWLNRHQDPADPLTRPVELLLQMFLVGTNLTAVFLVGLGGAMMAIAAVGMVAVIKERSAAETIIVPRGEKDAMQQWVDSGQASRLMRCEADGLIFVNGRCHTIDAGWQIPLSAQMRLAGLAKDNADGAPAAWSVREAPPAARKHTSRR